MPDPRNKDTNRGFEAREVIEQKDLGMDEGYDEGFRDEGYELGEQETGNEFVPTVGRGTDEELGDDEDFEDVDKITSREDFEVVNPDVEIGTEPNRE